MRNNLMNIIKKEMKRVFSDKRLALSIFLVPALTIAIVYSFMGIMLSNMMEDTQANVPDVYVVGSPEDFIALVRSNYIEGVSLHVAGRDEIDQIKDWIRESSADALLVFEDGFNEKIHVGTPLVEKYINSVSDYSIRAGHIMDSAMETYRQSILIQRLGSPDAVMIFSSHNHDLAQEHEKAGKALGFLLPMLLTLFLFAGAMQVGMDTIAGEKERGTIATILMTPVKRRDIALGKMISLGIVAILSCLSSLTGVLASLPFSNALFAGGFDVSNIGYGAWDILGLLLLMAVLAFSFVSMICLASVLAKSNKEAGSYIAPMYMVVMIMGFSIMFANFKDSIWPYFIPLYGNVISIKDVITFESNAYLVLVSCASTLVLTIVLIFAIIRAFESENMMRNI
ncbi:MAG: ABC transporter permease subunit [Clostridia bacterium]